MNDEKFKLRLVVMGDLSLSPKGLPEVEEAIDDLNQLHPDVILVPGDLDDTRQGFDAASETLRAFNGIVLPAIGNHDLEVECCKTDEENVELFVEAFGLENHYYAYEYAGILFITLSTERYRSHRWQPHEVFLSDEQLDWFRQTLEVHPTMPTIVQCHAPIFGTQIPVIPTVHVRSTNPYTNHNHHPERILELIGGHPQIILWFSGHSHLGQGYPNSICHQRGVYFVHVGVHGSRATRDGCRHSRVVEIEPDHILIRTFDHAQRAIDPRFDYGLDEGADGLMSSWEASTCSGFLSGRLKGFHVGQNGLSLKPLPTSGFLAYLDKPASPSVHAICPTERKIYVATQGGYVWEYDHTSGLPLGAIYMDKSPTCILATDSHVWIGGGDRYLRKVPTDKPERFLRKNSTDVHDEEIHIKGIVRAMRLIDRNRILVGADRRLYEINSQTDELTPKAIFKKNVLALMPDRESLYVLTENGELEVFSLADLQLQEPLKIPSQLSESGFRFGIDFIHITNQICFLVSKKHHTIIKCTLDDMKVTDQFRIPGKIQTTLFDEREIYVLTESGRLICLDVKGMTIKMQRDLEMEAASTMGLDDQFIYVATSNPDSPWQEVQIIERSANMIGELAFSVRSVNDIYPQLEMDMELIEGNFFHADLRAKVGGKWVKLEGQDLLSREFEIRMALGRGRAEESPYISRMKLKGRH
jgi:3',5'-cyclic AMP phosphodiesterase CpdA